MPPQEIRSRREIEASLEELLPVAREHLARHQYADFHQYVGPLEGAKDDLDYLLALLPDDPALQRLSNRVRRETTRLIAESYLAHDGSGMNWRAREEHHLDPTVEAFPDRYHSTIRYLVRGAHAHLPKPIAERVARKLYSKAIAFLNDFAGNSLYDELQRADARHVVQMMREERERYGLLTGVRKALQLSPDRSSG